MNIKENGYGVNTDETHMCGFVVGCAWLSDHLYRQEGLQKLISNCNTENELICLLQELNGFYAGTVRLHSFTYLFTDHLASIPLFYDTCKKKIYRAPNSDWKNNVEYDEIAITEVLKTTMFSCNLRTFGKGIIMPLPGTVLKISKDGSFEEICYYRHYLSCSLIKPSKDDYLIEIADLNNRVFRRVIDYLDGKTAIVPLSGGYDSRFIVAMLKELNYKNVVCYTYGFSENTYETRISKKVADVLEYRHFCVILDESKWDEFFDDTTIKDFLDYGFSYANLPHIQEVIALRELRKLPEFPKEGVVIPGFCGDLFGGSYTLTKPQLPNTEYSLESAVDYIFRSNFFGVQRITKYDSVIKKDIKEFLRELPYTVNDYKTFDSAQMEWFISHKVARFILPCNKTFEFFGYSWYMPLWDKELVEFWYKIPNDYKQVDSLYEYSLMKLLFENNNIAFTKVKNHRKRYVICNNKALHKRIKKFVYGAIMFIYYKTGHMFYFKKESNNFDYLCRLCYRRLKNKKVIKFSEIVRFETLAIWWVEQKVPMNVLEKIFD